MAFPAEKEIRQAIKDELQAMGGEAKLDVLLPKVTRHLRARFPDITDADLQRRDPKTGLNSWNHHLHSVRSRMVKTQPPELAPTAPRGVWRLPALAKKAKEEPRLTHDELVQKIKEIGQMLGRTAEGPWGPVYKHDCVWKDNPYANPKLVWEVCDKGILDKDIASLDWAVTNWGAEGILAIFDAADFQSAQKKLAQKSQIYPLKAEDVLKLHSLLQAGNIQAVRSIFAV